MCQTREEYIKQGMLETVMLPFLSDVLLGRGKPITDHIGNIRLHSIVEENLPAYNSSRICFGIRDRGEDQEHAGSVFVKRLWNLGRGR
jgi:hypothetical protein